MCEVHNRRVLSSARTVAFVPSTDLARSRAFYEGVLGLPIASQDPFAVVVRFAEATIRITAVGDSLTVQPFTVLGWEVDDIGSAVRDLAAKGVEFLRFDGMPQDDAGVWTSPDGTKVAWFHDPDGNTLSIDAH
jgi:catechol 2,3-dioxygenase-like lactoylglutathione lyase family enzyme